MKTLITILLIATALICFVKIFDIGLRRYERSECIKWEQQSRDFKDAGWYATDWQKEQCKQFGIEL